MSIFPDKIMMITLENYLKVRDQPVFKIYSTVDIPANAKIKLLLPACFSHGEHSIDVRVLNTKGKEAVVTKIDNSTYKDWYLSPA